MKRCGETRSCLKCGGPLPAPAGTGRPRRFCSTGCRRGAEYELRRLQRHLERLEERLGNERLWRNGTAWKQRVRDLEAAIAAAEGRLKCLLTIGETDD